MWVLAAFAAMNGGCSFLRWGKTQPRQVEWPDERSAQLLVPSMEAGAAIAAAASVREMVRQALATDANLFWGCASPEQGLDASVFKGPAPDVYYVVLSQRFDRCGGPAGRVLDWWYVYAATAQGEVLGRAPPMAWEEPPASAPAPVTPEPAPAAPETEMHPRE